MTLPQEFVDSISSFLPEDEIKQFVDALASEPQTSIRINRHKFASWSPKYDLVPWCKDGMYVDVRPTYTLDPLFHAGAYYVQEASSMFVSEALRQVVRDRINAPLVLDLCASPGGKSTLIASEIAEYGGFLLSNEISKLRAATLAENMTKWGLTNTAVSSNAPKDFTDMCGLFDVILVDAPCSGEGMFRKDEESISEWSEANVRMCQTRQREILDSILPALKTGGILIYSTCTYNRLEDEENVRYLIDNHDMEQIDIDTDPSWNIAKTDEGYHFFPHRTRGEGLFLSVLRKTADEDEVDIYPHKKDKRQTSSVVPSEVMTWIESDGITIDGASAVPTEWAHHAAYFRSHLRILKCGTPLFELKGRDAIPMHSLAVSTVLRREAFYEVDLDWEGAIAYLRRDPFPIPSDAPKGYILLTFRGIPLGFAKNLGNRANNTYPQNWRILMAADAERYVEII